MEIKFVKRENIINNILDRINAGEKIDDDLMKLLKDLSK